MIFVEQKSQKRETFNEFVLEKTKKLRFCT